MCSEMTDHTAIYEKTKFFKKELQELCKGEGTPFGAQGHCLEILSNIEKKIKENDAKKIM